MVFAIIDPVGTGNLRPFKDAFRGIDSKPGGTKATCTSAAGASAGAEAAAVGARRGVHADGGGANAAATSTIEPASDTERVDKFKEGP